MDRTPEYIEMCKKATEIQEQKPPHVSGCQDAEGEWGSFNGDTQQIKDWFPEEWQLYVWLPRQDQLQEMVPGFVELGRWPIPMVLKFADFCDEVANNPLKWAWPVPTTEQLWLAFLMKELHGKTWDFEKKEWVKE